MTPPPPFVTWAEGLSTQTVGEDLFFWPSRTGGIIFILVFVVLKFSEFPGPPLLKILRTLLLPLLRNLIEKQCWIYYYC